MNWPFGFNDPNKPRLVKCLGGWVEGQDRVIYRVEDPNSNTPSIFWEYINNRWVKVYPRYWRTA